MSERCGMAVTTSKHSTTYAQGLKAAEPDESAVGNGWDPVVGQLPLGARRNMSRTHETAADSR
jgi:hypothetical protein